MPAAPHPDQEEAAREIAEALGTALGADVQVKPTRTGGYVAELKFAGPEEALELRASSALSRRRVSRPYPAKAGGGPVARIVARGRLAQMVRALL